MLDLMQVPARRLLSARREVDRAELERLLQTETLVIDERRRRPLYFDGRFLAARDLTRERTYFEVRQADLGRSVGSGIVHGLMVRTVAEPTDPTAALEIAPGFGITPAGETVFLDRPLRLSLSNVPEIQRLDATFGLLEIPREPARGRTGLFILALRPVEFTANPIASYPTSIDGRRSIEDGDVIEAVAATLIPYADHADADQVALRRAYVAREIFVEGADRGLPVQALPLAMLALDHGVVQWLDPFMVRREIGPEHGQVLGLGFAPRALREAHLLQYDAHLRQVLAERDRAGRGRRFAASEHFLALPPGGRLPAGAINPGDFTQSYFPPEVDVELSIVPVDEVPVLLDESLLLPPIDLTLPGDRLDSTAVLIVVPLPREEVRDFRTRLDSLRRPLRPALPGLVARRLAVQAVQLPRLRLPVLPTIDPDDVRDAPWRQLLQRFDQEGRLLWYVRRRNLAYRAEVSGLMRLLRGDEVREESLLIGSIDAAGLGLATRFRRIRERATLAASADMAALLGNERVRDSKLVLAAAIAELEAAAPTPPETPEAGQPDAKLDQATVTTVAERFTDPRLGEGIERLASFEPKLASDDTTVRTLARALAVPELDLLGKTLPDDQAAALAAEVATVAARGKTEEVVTIVSTRLAEFKR